MKRIHLIPAMAVLVACFGCADQQSSRSGTKSSASPLGIEYPDPMVILQAIQNRMAAGDWPGTCAHLAGLGRNGQPVPLIPGENVESVPGESLKAMNTYLPLFSALERPWVSFRYGAVRSLRNAPPFFAVPVMVEYDYDRIQPEERALMLKRFGEEQKRPVTWEEFVATMRQAEGRGEGQRELAFAFLDQSWRLYLGAIPRSAR
ncbi:MAG TPA: hypothetical protein PKA37_09340 [Planctomycetota bacterium]|nr:hypothetical protein [Planctomycetota bacterium]